jgi:protein-S-isoprenylcysteine O-methyltransferase Ste14
METSAIKKFSASGKSPAVNNRTRRHVKSAVERHRRWINLTLWSLIFAFIVFTRPRAESYPLYELMKLTGFVLTLAATMGTLWCGLYMFGCKSKELCRDGPYSVCRNPLYLFAFMGGLGVVLASVRPLLTVAFALIFWGHYFLIIKSEEKRLLQLFGKDYESYSKRTPRLLPRFKNYWSREKIVVNSHRQLLGIVKSMRFLGMFLALELIEVLKHIF